ncbi:Leucine rich repeat [Carpediemonas membranifera]|uniref:Leucine rich repeat n=1 Tax=Carpediemonas membranifera TaxID=201153 RepID=A0A8J6AZ92_9EUKA|nr:Leucine rich repeat [Carpediemonas membranifera]|eukprot:KAG9389564.1 Leucine rich repeat [Carpediemonas membranifera]
MPAEPAPVRKQAPKAASGPGTKPAARPAPGAKKAVGAATTARSTTARKPVAGTRPSATRQPISSRAPAKPTPAPTKRPAGSATGSAASRGAKPAPKSASPGSPTEEEQELLVTKLFKLERLNLDRCGLITLSGIEVCSEARTVNLQFNELTTLDSIESLNSIRHLDVSQNKLTSITGKLGGMEHLQTLLATDNRLDCLDPASVDLTQLSDTLLFLNLSGNKNADSPDFIAQVLKTLPGLILYNGRDPRDVASSGDNAVEEDEEEESIGDDLPAEAGTTIAEFEARMGLMLAEGEARLDKIAADITGQSRTRQAGK